MKNLFTTIFIVCISIAPSMLNAQHSVAREWNELLLTSIRNDFARPTVHARNLFHCSAAMYDAWAIADPVAVPYFLGQSRNGYFIDWKGITIPPGGTEAFQEEAMSFAVYRLLKLRFTGLNAAINLYPLYDAYMAQLGYDITDTSTDYHITNKASSLGNYLAQEIYNFGLLDGSNEANDYGNTSYTPVNDPLVMDLPGNPDIDDLNRWQPLTLDVFIDQSGNVIPGATPDFLSPEWGQVYPFCLSDADKTTYTRDGFDYHVYHDPGLPPEIDTLNGGTASDDYKWAHKLVTKWGSHLDTADQVVWDISPASIGNISSYPTTVAGMKNFYDEDNGGDNSPGHSMNPITSAPYPAQNCLRGDYARVLAEFWADGPDSETPPGHWFTILNYVNDHPQFVKKFEGTGNVINDLEWDVKSYFMMGGAMHDAAITAWGCKGWYDYIRPVSSLRAMAELGQSSDPTANSYHIGGIPLDTGYVELIETGDPLAGFQDFFVGKIKFKTWRGPGYITDPSVDMAGVDWIISDYWFPYQRPTFVTPPFAGYVSGHSTFSRAAAEVMTLLTGDAFFPGGMGEFVCPKNEFLVFEEGPSDTVRLQWATYYDASDQCSLSRIWGGIHPPVDDIPGRLMGIEVGIDAFNCAKDYFTGAICEGTLHVDENPIPNTLYEADQAVYSTGTVISGNSTIFQAGNFIQLDPGFTVDQGGVFTTQLIGCN